MSDVSDSDFSFVQDLVRRESAIALDSDMKYLVESRLTSLARKTEYGTLQELLNSLRNKQDDRLTASVIEAMTTNETSFFRDAHPFDTLCDSVLPSIADSHPDIINIWCAACATGQEPYTIAMSILEKCSALAPRVNILATDLSSEVVDKTELGLYTKLEVNRGLPIQMLAKYFTKKGLSWQVGQELREMVTARTMNLIGDWSALPSIDVIFMRNVLIYFDPDVKSSVLNKTSTVLKPEGYLFLGLSETVLNLDTCYERKTSGPSSYFQITR
ncbi:MAG: protein-glutamate O-methyltransferase CheR [Granulosicoccus sp.]